MVFALLVVLAALRWQAPLVATSAVGLPLLFVLYMKEGDVYQGLPILTLAGAAVLGAAFGYGWATLTGDHLSRAISMAQLSGGTTHTTLVYGVLVPLGTAALTVAPGVLMRLLARHDSAEPMDGYLSGALGAIGFACASTFTLLAPQLRNGVSASGRPLTSLIEEALLQGVAIPLTAVGVGGVVGAAVWLRRRERSAGGRAHSGRWLSSPVTTLAATAVVYVVLGLVDVWQPSDWLVVALHLIGAALTLLALRFGMHSALLHEKHVFQIGPPAVCAQCEQIVAQMPFCALCGAATHVSSRHYRQVLQLPNAGLLPAASTPPEEAR